jgi:glycosyltransferase involved in cell wall biosynthesis
MIMNVLHLQFDTEIRTIYEIKGMPKSSQISNYLAYTGLSYTEKVGNYQALFKKMFILPNVSLRIMFYIKRSKSFIGFLDELNSIVHRNDIDVIHVHKRTDIQCLAALMTGKPVVIDAHDLVCLLEDSISGSESHLIFRLPLLGKIIAKTFYRKLQDLEKNCLIQADHIIAVSPIMKKRIVEMYSINPEKISVLPNTVPKDYCLNKRRESYGKPIKAILSSSFFLNKKSTSHRNILPLIDAIKDVDGIEICIYGWTKGKSDQEIERLLSNYRNVVYCGMLKLEEYEKVIGDYDIGIIFNNPNFDKSIVEMSLPKKLFEYCSKGLPILAYGSDQISEFIEYYQIGASFNEISKDAISDAIAEIKMNYPKYSQNCINLIKNHYNWNAQCDTLNLLYEDMCSAHASENCE